MTVLKGIKIIELAGIGPGPFCGMLLADLGADVIVIERPGGGDLPAAITRRGKRSVALDLKSPESIETVLRLIESADALIEGMRPGVMERLGLGPDVCLSRNPRLVYGRMTGWGQDGPLAQAAGHDTNYIALSGALWYASEAGQPPVAPPTLVGDLGGGALYLAVGILAGILNARSSGQGQVVDAAIVDGSAHLMNLMLDLIGGGLGSEQRGTSLLDGPHWYTTYRCADGRDITVGALEPKFYRLLLEKLGLQNDPRFASQNKTAQWPQQKQQLAELFATKSREEWCALLEGSDACFAPVLAPSEAARHPHIAQRKIYSEEGGLLQANPAPRFSSSPAAATRPVPKVGEHTQQVLEENTKSSR
ncbi:CaiB/BaiF CoA transferase family protein [Noviherbaspirillum saxi]|uniref:CoA transferase n=1 Tax=Noviherbaspirillum saxi TaxID=2320863 RepID=A0A3A3G8U0_9BURK|nr:CaiB/BaiF CoA-transferase family protein [Noviherbaspirillum saxi]RJF98565.1 CoA transferase [Noviherbaspirillum saxi]